MGNNTCEVGGEPLFTPTPHVCDVGGWGRQGEALPSGDLISESGQETGGSADHHGGQGRVPAQARWTEGVPSIKPPAEAGVQLPSAWCFLFDKIPLHGGPERLNKD